jgi:hypothetical protein
VTQPYLSYRRWLLHAEAVSWRASLEGHRWRLFTTLLWRAVDVQRMHRAQRVYSALIANIRSRGYFVQTYQLPYLPVERKAHSSLLDRMLGTVDVRGDQEVHQLCGPSRSGDHLAAWPGCAVNRHLLHRRGSRRKLRPAVAIRSANHHLRMLRLALWISSHLLYLVFILLLAIALIGWRWRVRKIKGSPST